MKDEDEDDEAEKQRIRDADLKEEVFGAEAIAAQQLAAGKKKYGIDCGLQDDAPDELVFMGREVTFYL